LGLSLVSPEDHKLAKPNYQFEKRKRDIAKKAKKEEKKLRKLRPSVPSPPTVGDELSLEMTKLVAGHIK
jgi:hypothetical protein